MNLPDRCRLALRKAFTLIELITVIAIIAILMGLLLPTVTQVRNQANRAKAKSDVLNIVTAVKSYYTDYGQYPGPSTAPTTDQIIGPLGATPAAAYPNSYLMDVLRDVTDTSPAWMVSGTDNLRATVYLDVPNAKSASAPKGGIATVAIGSYNGHAVNVGDFIDPWGTAYFVVIDYNYDNVIDPTTGNIWSDVNTASAATSVVRAGVIAFSLGVDGQLGTAVAGVGNKVLNATSSAAASDDVVSFQ